MTQEEFRTEMQRSAEAGCRRLFDEYCSYVYTIVFNRLRQCASREDIDECVGDVFAEIYRSFDTEGGFSGDMSGFVGTVARRRAAYVYNRLTAGKKTVSLDDEELETLPSDADVEAEAERSEMQSMLLDKIAELGEPDATILIQKYYYGRSAKEIAGFVPLSPEAIRVRCGRAVKKLKKLLDDSGITL